MPEEIIKEVTGHRSTKALGLYERPSLAQKKAVSKVLAEFGSFSQEVKNFAQQTSSSSNGATESAATPVLASAHSAKQLDCTGLFSSLFSGLTNCTINIAPQQLNINIGVGSSHQQDEALVAELPPSIETFTYLCVCLCTHSTPVM